MTIERYYASHQKRETVRERKETRNEKARKNGSSMSSKRFVPAASFLHIDLLSFACVVFTFFVGTLKSIASLFHIKIIHVIVHFIIHKLEKNPSTRECSQKLWHRSCLFDAKPVSCIQFNSNDRDRMTSFK